MNFKNYFYLAVFISLVIFVVMPLVAKAGDCYQDPIYERDLHGKYNISAYVRDNPCMEGTNIIETVTQGTVVQIIAETDGWYKVQTPKGNIGWTGSRLMTITDEPLTSSTGSSNSSSGSGSNSSSIINVDPYNDTSFLGRVRGKLLLQVEDKGRIWYVDPANDKRYEVLRETALELFRNHALGITNVDINKIPTVDETNNYNNLTLRSRVRGKILLQVEDAGKTWYVIPGELRRVRITAETLMDIFRKYSLGITNADLVNIPLGSGNDVTVAFNASWDANYGIDQFDKITKTFILK